MTCNVNSMQVDNNYVYQHITAKLDQDTATDIASTYGLTAAGIEAAALIVAEATAFSSGTLTIPATVVAVTIIAEAWWIDVNANGCGVEVEAWVSPVSWTPTGPVPYHEIRPQ